MTFDFTDKCCCGHDDSDDPCCHGSDLYDCTHRAADDCKFCYAIMQIQRFRHVAFKQSTHPWFRLGMLIRWFFTGDSEEKQIMQFEYEPFIEYKKRQDARREAARVERAKEMVDWDWDLV